MKANRPIECWIRDDGSLAEPLMLLEEKIIINERWYLWEQSDPYEAPGTANDPLLQTRHLSEEEVRIAVHTQRRTPYKFELNGFDRTHYLELSSHQIDKTLGNFPPPPWLRILALRLWAIDDPCPLLCFQPDQLELQESLTTATGNMDRQDDYVSNDAIQRDAAWETLSFLGGIGQSIVSVTSLAQGMSREETIRGQLEKHMKGTNLDRWKAHTAYSHLPERDHPAVLAYGTEWAIRHLGSTVASEQDGVNWNPVKETIEQLARDSTVKSLSIDELGTAISSCSKLGEAHGYTKRMSELLSTYTWRLYGSSTCPTISSRRQVEDKSILKLYPDDTWR